MNLEKVFVKFGNIVGHNHVFTAAQALEMYGSNTNAIEQSILGALRPHSVEEIQKIVTICNKEKLSLYPISTGHNWGYGTSTPITDNNIILDLSGMNTILDFDKQLGTVTVEPGVTQKILYDFLEKHGHTYLVPLTGAGPKGSIMGNALERGFGVTPFADHFSAITTITAVLPDGSIYKSPLEEFGCARIDRLYKYGIGPYLDAIFAQGNFGIVTSITITLARKPKKTKVFLFTIKNSETLSKVIDRLPETLGLLGSTTTGIKFINETQIAAMHQGKRMDPSLKHFQGWTVTGGLFGDPEIVKASEKILKRELTSLVGRIIVVDANIFDKYKHFLKFLPWYSKLRRAIQTFSLTISLYLGKPSTAALPLAYLKSGTPPHKREELDPGKDGAGLIWYAPLIPVDGKTVAAYYAKAIKILEKHGIPQLVTFTTVNDRCFDSPLPIVFDKNDPIAVKKAKECYNELWETSLTLGLMPYRIPVDEMHRLTETMTPFWTTVGKVKKSLDKNNVIAPGRYGKIL
jgi:4-cresol dehydrogenase (hydroxylating)